MFKLLGILRFAGLWGLWRFLILLFLQVLSQCGTPAYACPQFVEFYPDPIEVTDQEGEFVEIRLDNGLDFEAAPSDSLLVQLEEKAPLRFAYPSGKRFLLVHDSAFCVREEGVSCGLLGSIALPNSRESVWSLSAGNCLDSAVLPRPKPGKSLQRLKDSDEWVVTESTPGIANSYYEWGVSPESEKQDSVIPLKFTEIHHCPAEPEPEWVEVYNAGASPLPLSKFSFCGRGSSWGSSRDSIAPYEAIILTKDTLLLREFLGFKEVRLFQVSMGYLNNTAGSIAICKGETVIDSVAWNKSTVKCPAGFNPQTFSAENTPGFLGHRINRNKIEEPFNYKLSSRILRRGKTPLRIYIEGEVSVTLRLLDSAGREVWSRLVPPQSNTWWNVPLEGVSKVGVAYVVLSAGRYEKQIGILLRP